MWLLDVNVPRQLKGLLSELGVPADLASQRGWGTLTNGDLLQEAAAAGFTCLLTRDRLFGESASRSVKRYPDVSIVLVVLPQVRASQFLEEFRIAWTKHTIVPSPGQIISWP
jgi:hypothetical protein